MPEPFHYPEAAVLVGSPNRVTLPLTSVFVPLHEQGSPDGNPVMARRDKVVAFQVADDGSTTHVWLLGSEFTALGDQSEVLQQQD